MRFFSHASIASNTMSRWNLNSASSRFTFRCGATAVFGIFPLSRWGDYTSMAIDPADDCTYWYTNEYLQANGGFNWSTRIASFSFPSCTTAPADPDFYVAVSPGFRLASPGTSTTFGINLNPIGGFSDTVTFSATGLPAGATASFSPSSVAVSESRVSS